MRYIRPCSCFMAFAVDPLSFLCVLDQVGVFPDFDSDNIGFLPVLADSRAMGFQEMGRGGIPYKVSAPFSLSEVG